MQQYAGMAELTLQNVYPQNGGNTEHRWYLAMTSQYLTLVQLSICDKYVNHSQTTELQQQIITSPITQQNCRFIKNNSHLTQVYATCQQQRRQITRTSQPSNFLRTTEIVYSIEIYMRLLAWKWLDLTRLATLLRPNLHLTCNILLTSKMMCNSCRLQPGNIHWTI